MSRKLLSRGPVTLTESLRSPVIRWNAKSMRAHCTFSTRKFDHYAFMK